MKGAIKLKAKSTWLSIFLITIFILSKINSQWTPTGVYFYRVIAVDFNVIKK